MQHDVLSKIDLTQDLGPVLDEYFAATGEKNEFEGFGQVLPRIEGGRIPYGSAGELLTDVGNPTAYKVFQEWHRFNSGAASA